MSDSYERFDVKPVTSSLGAEISGLDLSKPVDDRVFEDLYRAFIEFQVVFVLDQDLSRENQMEISRRFGEPVIVPFLDHMPDYPYIVDLVKEPNEQNISNFGGEWHSDYSFLPAPPSTTAVYAIEVPPYGGDTIWANMYQAYDTLTNGMKRLLDGLNVIHRGTPFGTRGQPEDGRRTDADGRPIPLRSPTSITLHRNRPEADAEQSHPIVAVHPVSRRKALFINQLYMVRIEGVSARESKPILESLYTHSTQPEFVCRHRWKAGTLAIWDNRCTQHYALNDYDGFRRVMNRTQIIETEAVHRLYSDAAGVEHISRVGLGRL